VKFSPKGTNVILLIESKQGSKPWRYTGKEENMDREDIKMLVKKWFDIYNDESLDYKAEPKQRLQPFREALTEASAVRYFTAPSAA